ncbi:MAG: hypothetical protein AAGA96_04130 [Verrucomicrobiota bacterium]
MIFRNVFSVSFLALVYADALSQTEIPLSGAEADRIVQEEQRVTKAREVVETEKLRDAQVLRSRTITTPDGGTMTLNLVAPPSTSEIPSPRRIINSQSNGSSELSTRGEKKPNITISLFATVFSDGNRRFTELTWQHQGKRYSGFSNVDFSDFQGKTRLESDTSNYSLILVLAEADVSDFRVNGLPSRQFPASADFTSRRPEFYYEVPAGEKDPDPSAFEHITFLHKYYEEHQAELRVAKQRRDQIQMARQRHQDSRPTVPRQTTVNFWKKSAEAPE